MTTKRPWTKVWSRWYETDSHALLSFGALHVGPRLMTTANASPTRGELRAQNGAPLTAAQIGVLCRCSETEMVGYLTELVSAGTLGVREGVWFFPAFERWQESPQANRMRRHRERHCDAQSDGVGDALLSPLSSVFSSSVSSEGEPEREFATDHTLTALLEWWRWAPAPEWCPAPRRTGRIASRFYEVARLAVAHSPDASSPLEAVQRYVERAWENAWVAEHRLGGAWLLGADAKAADVTELEERIVRVLDGVGAEKRAARPKHPVIVARDMALEAAAPHGHRQQARRLRARRPRGRGRAVAATAAEGAGRVPRGREGRRLLVRRRAAHERGLARVVVLDASGRGAGADAAVADGAAVVKERRR